MDIAYAATFHLVTGALINPAQYVNIALVATHHLFYYKLQAQIQFALIKKYTHDYLLTLHTAQSHNKSFQITNKCSQTKSNAETKQCYILLVHVQKKYNPLMRYYLKTIYGLITKNKNSNIFRHFTKSGPTLDITQTIPQMHGNTCNSFTRLILNFRHSAPIAASDDI